MEISLYQTAEGNLVAAIIRLLEKIYASKKKCIFYSPIDERVKIVDKTLWTFSTNAFIPHGDRSLGFQKLQPIYLTENIENPNNASTLVLVDTLDYTAWGEDFEKIIFIFEDQVQTKAAEILYEDLKKRQKNVNYWCQTPAGWQKTA
ncbi:MAG: DNA polymerase III subunit chi [Holosporaceae bacterium]|jgi:DNA polymerase-3 subunit chi|nr:DNA polymerase III subunit chi [Holosporaceae bacterium]